MVLVQRMGYTCGSEDEYPPLYSHRELESWWQKSQSEQGLHSMLPPMIIQNRRLSLPMDDNGKKLSFKFDDSDADEEFRQRSSSLPSKLKQKSDEHTTTVNENISDIRMMSDRKLFALMTNMIHIIVGVAMTQLGIVGTWYQRYMNFEKDQLRHVLYICTMFIVLGVYGLCVVMKQLGKIKSHRIVYTFMSTLSVIASGFIFTNGIRIFISDTYQTNHRVIMIFDMLIITLSGIEIPTALVGLYATVKFSTYEPSNSETRLPERKENSANWGSTCSIILDVSHIVLGLCIAELSLVGFMYRQFMNIDSNGFLAVVITSLSLVSVGIAGLYNQATGKQTQICHRFMYTFGSLLAVGSATTIMVVITMAMSNKQYYTGVEAIRAFDVMILSMSSMELVVGLAATALCIIPFILPKLNTYTVLQNDLHIPS